MVTSWIEAITLANIRPKLAGKRSNIISKLSSLASDMKFHYILLLQRLAYGNIERNEVQMTVSILVAARELP